MAKSEIEIIDEEPISTEFIIPNIVTGYIGFYKSDITKKWEIVYPYAGGGQIQMDSILPYNSFRSRDDLIKSAQGIIANVTTLKIIRVDFNV